MPSASVRPRQQEKTNPSTAGSTYLFPPKNIVQGRRGRNKNALATPQLCKPRGYYKAAVGSGKTSVSSAVALSLPELRSRPPLPSPRRPLRALALRSTTCPPNARCTAHECLGIVFVLSSGVTSFVQEQLRHGRSRQATGGGWDG